MLKIALCDDEPGQRSLTGGLLREYMEQRPSLAARLTVVSSGEELLEQAEAEGGFDLYVLDVIMPELSGIDVGVKLRELGSGAPIIYLTTSPDYAVDSYLAQAFYYILKPVDRSQLFEVLDRAAALLEKRRAVSMPIKTKSGVRLAPLDEILYVELAGRLARYHLTGGETVDSMTLHGPFQAEIAPLLEDARFVLCGSSFAVNLHYVTAVDKGELTVGNHFSIPLPRRLVTQVKKQWGEYWLKGGGEPC